MKGESHRIDVIPEFQDPLAFDVLVHEGKSQSRHRVTLSSAEAARFSFAPPARVVEASMKFLLDREPKESILDAFDIGVIRRYFPEYDRVMPDYLASLAGS